MNYEAIILHMLSKLERERTVNSVYHILRGKRSAQTIQDIHLFNLQQFYGIYPNLNLKNYEEWITRFKQNHWINENDNMFTLTDEGHIFVKKQLMNKPLKFDGLKFHRKDQLFLKTLQLLCQTVSNLIYDNHQFIPIVDSLPIQQKVKKMIRKYRENRPELYEGLFIDLYTIFNELSEEPIDYLARQLTSANQIGLSKQQIAELENSTDHAIHFVTIHLIHQMLSIVEQNKGKYPFLEQLIDTEPSRTLTHSASITERLLNQRKTIEDISRIRRLKVSTIEDHIVEIATQNQHFSIRPFVDERLEKEIIARLNEANTARLKIIKDMLPDTVTYFQIRLVLTKWSLFSNEQGGREDEFIR